MLSRKVLGAKAVVVPPVYVEDIFSTWLYTGNGGQATITNGMNLSGQGGMVWFKQRSGTANNTVQDTVRGTGAGTYLNTNNATAAAGGLNGIQSFTSTGFTLSSSAEVNSNTQRYVAWTFCKQPKFFDVVSYTGNGAFAQSISHNLGSTPGFIIIKRFDASGNWAVAAQYASGAYKELILNSNGSNLGDFSPSATSTTVTVGGNWSGDASSPLNASGATYIAYLFANNAGGFGIGGTESAIACGLYTGNSIGDATINLGWEPQWILFKSTTELDNWKIVDIQRGLMFNEQPWNLYPNATSVEGQANPRFLLNPTGYQVQAGANTDYIYVAIRRPMKVPTDATKVFMPVVYTGTNVDNRLVSTTVMPDMVWARQRNSTSLNGMIWGDRLRGNNYLVTGLTNSENGDLDSLMTPFLSYGQSFMQNGFGVGNDTISQLNASTTANNQVVEAFSRAPGFFDTVCYTGDGVSGRTVNHGLKAVPQLMIIKSRSDSYGGQVYFGDPEAFLLLNNNNGQTTGNFTRWNGTAPTNTQFTLGNFNAVNLANATYVAELFASCPGVSKIGTYTGTGAGTSQNIDCGFTNGVRLVLIKRIDAEGQWILFDSARGITAANDPYLLLFEIQAEVTNSNFLDTYSAGFTLTINAPSAMNAGGGTYLYLAIA